MIKSLLSVDKVFESWMRNENNMKNLNQKWHSLKWREIFKYVTNLQRELVVAYKNDDWKTIYFLQNKLMMSFEGRAIAVRKTVSNDGKKTPGIDKEIWNNPSDKFLAISRLREILVKKTGSYQSGPIRRVWVPKSKPGELRPLGIPNMIDRALQALILMCLDPIIEEKSDLYSYGFRKYRSSHDAIQKIRTILDKPFSPMWVWDVDISKCFDSISHEYLEGELGTVLSAKGNEFTSKWLKAPIIDKGIIEIPKKGTPQGNILSPLLCNITLNGLENVVRPGLPLTNTGAARKLIGSWLIRYADDFIITSPSRERLIEDNIPKVTKFLSLRGLEISEKKSSIRNLEIEGFNFLGWRIEKRKRDLTLNKSKKAKLVLIISPKKDAVKRFKTRIKEEFRSNKPIVALIKDLNPILRGWTNYYRSSYHSQKVFQSIGHYIYQSWWKWAQKKHPNRNKHWIYNQYIFKTPKRSWQIGFSQERLLFDISLAQQIKVSNLRNHVNPYTDEDYYISRIIIRDAQRFRKAVYKLNNFKCNVCDQSLHGPEKIHLHHVTSRKDGGKYTLENIVPVHEICHESITYARKE
jgi:RNA-directed DNA polymerase